VVLNKRANRTL